jgi:hypothetical protein
MNAADAIQAIKNLSAPSLPEIRAILAQVEIDTPAGRTIVFYSGPLETFEFRAPGDLHITKYTAGQIASALAAQSDRFAVIDNTQLAAVLTSRELRLALAT